MNFEQQVQLSLTVLLIGFVIVFVMLVVLAYIIRGYGAAVSKIEKKMEIKQAGTPPTHSSGAVNVSKATATSIAVATAAPVPAAECGIPAEIIAAISAAVYMMYGTSVGPVTSIRRAAQPNRSAWRMAGILENTRPF